MATLYSYFNTGDDSNQGFYQTIGWLAQTFAVDTNHIISSVKVKLLRMTADAAPGTITATLKAVDGDDKPTGSALAAGTYANGNSITTVSPGEWVEITFTTGYLLLASTNYALILTCQTDDPTKPVAWRTDTSSPYTDGVLYLTTDQGSSWSGLSKDAMFEDWGSSIFIPKVMIM